VGASALGRPGATPEVIDRIGVLAGEGGREPALAVSQTALDVLELADGQQRPGVGDAQDRSSPDDLIR